MATKASKIAKIYQKNLIHFFRTAPPRAYPLFQNNNIPIKKFSPGPVLRPVQVLVLMCLSVCLLVCLSRPIYFVMMDVLLVQYTSDPQYFLQISDPL